MISFSIEKNSSECSGRTGVLRTRRGEIQTPIFMPVGTHGVVKTLSPKELSDVGARIILANTYHLFLRPGLSTLDHFGGLHRMMSWNGPILTDSGGFQAFSLKAINSISDSGIKFVSHLDGSSYELTPEESMRIQRTIGSEIIMCLDECTDYPATEEEARTAMLRSVNWAQRCRNDHPPNRNEQALFGIIQGSTNLNLRFESLERTLPIGFEGLAIGGLSVGEPKEEMIEILDQIVEKIPSHLPRYLMGVGTPKDLFMGIERGIDMFDCVMPTRIARHGSVYTQRGRIDITASRFKNCTEPLDSKCFCYACQTFSRGYLRHLFQNKEMLGMRMASLHNLAFMLNLTNRIRKALNEGKFLGFKKDFFEEYDSKEGVYARS
ncbi:tRNA guanosine(34) transglycosylase Tgt [bacterium]|nr:tRNA guanosine(34) transglycosylase Tgt [bacterium]